MRWETESWEGWCGERKKWEKKEWGESQRTSEKKTDEGEEKRIKKSFAYKQ